MKEKEIRVLMVEPQQKPKVVTLANNLDSLQKAVSIGADYQGLIEIFNLDDKTCVVCNEEGKLIGLEPNRRLGSDILCGVFYVAGDDGRGNLVSLTQEQQEQYFRMFERFDRIRKDEVLNAIFVSVTASEEDEPWFTK